MNFNEFKEKFDSTTKQGEKIRLSNLLYNYLYLIESAVKNSAKTKYLLSLKMG